MGCCISKCRTDQSQIHDKLVISQAPPTTPNISQYSNKISPICPPSPTSSTSSISSFTCITNSNTISSTSSLSTASSSLSSKDRSFSNDFLWSCYKDNPHIVRINSLKEASHSLTMSNKITQSIKPALSAIKQSQPLQKTAKSSMPQKRVRSSSPVNLTRQKSFRKEPDLRTPFSAYNLPSRTLRSPSPSRRFNGDKCGSAALPAPITENSLSKRILGGKANNNNAASLVMRKENLKPSMTTNSSSGKIQSGLRRRETCTYRVGSRIDETVVKRVLSENDSDSAFMEDIDNPLISLDCFIFL